MKHFTQFIHMLRSAWDGDRTRCLEQAYALAERLEGEGDTAHARMLRFTLQSLQSQTPVPDVRNAMVKTTTGSLPAPSAVGSAMHTARPASSAANTAPPDAERISLTFGSWDQPATS